MNLSAIDPSVLLWEAAGVVGAVIFYGRFYVQWIASERRGRSFMPIVFWYMSGAGSVVLLLYGVFYQHSPVGALSHCFNSVIYARNLVHIWRERGVLTQRLSLWFQGGVAALVLAGIALVVMTWLHEYHLTRGGAPGEAVRAWFWIGVGVAGQALFAGRFILQWAVTEIKKRSVVPPAFWYLSVAASLLLMGSHLQRGEWLYFLGLASTLLVYARNIYLIRTGRGSSAGE